MSTITYIKNFIKDRHVASITPTSTFGIQRLMEKIDFRTARVIVEYGPGTGIITEHLLNNLGPNARLVLIERNANFISILTDRFRDNRVLVEHGDARDVVGILQRHGLASADYVISGIPFSWLTDRERDQLVHHTSQILTPPGKFLAYQTFWQADEHLQNHLKRYFSSVDSGFVLLNAPPLRVYEAVRPRSLKTNGVREAVVS